jgi:hypothetical protein
LRGGQWADLGTGTGALAIALSSLLPHSAKVNLRCFDFSASRSLFSPPLSRLPADVLSSPLCLSLSLLPLSLSPPQTPTPPHTHTDTYTEREKGRGVKGVEREGGSLQDVVKGEVASGLQVFAVELSPDARQWAESNICRCGVQGRVEVRHQPPSPWPDGGCWSLVV